MADVDNRLDELTDQLEETRPPPIGLLIKDTVTITARVSRAAAAVDRSSQGVKTAL